MLRGDGIICGTSSSGTGTLTLASCPVPPGGVDFYSWLTATGIGFSNGNAVLVSYTIIEYTDANFTTASQSEKGIGTLTLGASLAASTLARTTVQSTATSLNSSGSPHYSAPSALNIVTAANVLIFLGPSAVDIPAYSPFYDTGIGENLGIPPLAPTSGSASFLNLTNLLDYYHFFIWHSPMLVKKATVRVAQAYSGTSGAPISSVYARLYDIGTAGRPSKLLYDFGALGAANPLNTLGNISSANSGSGFFLLPGEYVFDVLTAFSGAGGSVTNPNLRGVGSTGILSRGTAGTSLLLPNFGSSASAGTAGAAPDPANTTSYAGLQVLPPMFLLSPS